MFNGFTYHPPLNFGFQDIKCCDPIGNEQYTLCTSKHNNLIKKWKKNKLVGGVFGKTSIGPIVNL